VVPAFPATAEGVFHAGPLPLRAGNACYNRRVAKSLLLLLVLPPVNLILGIVAGWVLLFLYPRLGRWLVGLCAAALLALAMPAVAGTMLARLERGLPMTPPLDNPPQAIVILGAEMQRTAGAQPGAIVGRLTLDRLRAGAELYHRTQLPILVSGGLTQSDEPPIATLMADSLTQDFSVPVRWRETRSRDTWENAMDSAEILRAAGIHSIYLVTHAWHERRALMAFAHTGITVTVAPTPLDWPPTPDPDDFEPRASALQLSYYALHEWIGCAWYALR
jgi:uncharacterized SAM-binding protein YcdF (DUF218 family)